MYLFELYLNVFSITHMYLLFTANEQNFELLKDLTTYVVIETVILPNQ